jgi:hypothetical protein
MQQTKDGLLLEPHDVGKLIAALRAVAIATHQSHPDVQKLMLQKIDELERGVGPANPGLDLEVHGGRVFKRHAVRVVDHSDWVTLVGELDGVRAYCRERGGRVKVIMSKDDLYE